MNMQIPKGSIRRAAKRLSSQADAIAKTADDLLKIRDEMWDTSLSSRGNSAVINIHGPDCDIWASVSFEKAIAELIDNDPQEQVRKLPAWISAMEKALPKLKQVYIQAKVDAQ